MIVFFIAFVKLRRGRRTNSVQGERKEGKGMVLVSV